MDTTLIIKLAISGIMLLFLVVSVLYGLIVGFKESLATGIYNLVLVVILLIFINLITNQVINADLSWLGVNVNGASSINQILIDKICEQPDVNSILTSNPDVIDLIVKLPTMIVTPILFTILYWLVKIIVFIPALIVKLFVKIFTPKKKDANGKVIKKKKHHGFGALMGLATGVIAIFATFVPIFGIGDITTKLNSYQVENATITSSAKVVSAETENNEETDKPKTTPLLEYLFDDKDGNISKYLDAYNSSVGVTVSKVLGIKALGTVTYNNLSTTKVNNVKIKFVDEVDNALVVYVDYSNAMDIYKKDELTQEEMTTLINYLDNFVNGTFKSNIVKAVGNTLVPTIIDKVLNDPEFIIQIPKEIKNDEFKYALTRAILESVKNYDMPIVNENINQIINILKVTNDNKILTPLYNKLRKNEEITQKELLSLLKNSDDDFSEKLSSSITSINLLKDIAPQVVDSSLDALFDMMNLTYTTNNISKDDASNVIKTLIKNFIDGAKTLDLDSKLYVSKNTFGYIGNLINILKDEKVLTTTQYNDVINYVQTKAKEIDLPVDITKAINNLSNVENWQEEMTKISNAFDDFKEIYNTLDTKNIDLTTLDLAKVGTIFDKLETTTIFNVAITPIYNDVLDLTKNSGLNDYASVLDILKIDENINVNWENELVSIKPLLNSIVEFKDMSFTDIKSALKLIDFCGKFDEVEQNTKSTVYSSKMEDLLKEIIVTTKNLASSGVITEVCDHVSNKLNNRTTETLENCVIKGIFSYSETLIPSLDTFDDENIKAMITEIKANLNKIDNNEITTNLRDEIDYMITFSDIIEDLQNFDSLTDEQITNISNVLDSLSESKIFNGVKTHITNAIIDTAINSITNDDLNIKGLLEDLKNNLPNIEISTMLNDLKTIQDKVSNLTNIDITTMNTTEVANALETIRNTQTFDDNFTNNVMKNLLTKVNTDAQANTLLPNDKKQEIANYCEYNKTNLDNQELTSSTYKTILDGLKNLFE